MKTESEVLKKCKLPWDGFRKIYNNLNGTKFTTVKEWLSHMMQKYGSKNLVARELLVSESALYNLMCDLGLHKKQFSRELRPETYKARFLAIPPERMKEMTFIDLINALPDINETYLYALIQEHGRDFKRRSVEPPNKTYNFSRGR